MKDEVDILDFPSLNSPYGLCGRKATLKKKKKIFTKGQSSGAV